MKLLETLLAESVVAEVDLLDFIMQPVVEQINHSLVAQSVEI